MRKRIFIALATALLTCPIAAAQAKPIPPPADFERLVGRGKFDADKLRAAIVFPLSHQGIFFAVNFGQNKDDGHLAEIEKKFVDDFFRGKWSLESSTFNREVTSAKFRNKMVEHGKKKNDPAAFAWAAISLLKSSFDEANDSEWSPEKMTLAQKATLAALLEPIEELAEHKDKTIALNAQIIRAAMTVADGDSAKLKKYAHSALLQAPCDKAAIAVAFLAQTDEENFDYPGFWLEHARRHPSTQAWIGLAFFQFRGKQFDDVERSLLEAEKVDVKDRRTQLAKAALALKRGGAQLATAGRILNTLEPRLDERTQTKEFVVVTDMPSIRDCYRYLRAIHTALTGNWEKGRDELIALRESNVFADAISQALEAFPVRQNPAPGQGQPAPALKK